MMELDDLKSDWNESFSERRTLKELRRMVVKRKHPVLQGVKRQLAFETALYVALLFAYYSMFDGDQKPLYANVLLVFSTLLILVHNVFGLLATQNLIGGNNLKTSLKNYVKKLSLYAWLSVSSRVAAFVCWLLFFSSTLSIKGIGYQIWFGAFLIVLVQIYFLSRVWKKRINRLNQTLAQLDES